MTASAQLVEHSRLSGARHASDEDARHALTLAKAGSEIDRRRTETARSAIYRHYPTRADLIIAVYRHQVDACAEAGPARLANNESPYGALSQWIDLFVDFLVTKRGLAGVMRSDHAGFEALHAYFLDRLVPVCAQRHKAAARADEVRADVDALELMRGVGNLCVSIDGDSHYDARRMIGLLIAGLRQAQSS